MTFMGTDKCSHSLPKRIVSNADLDMQRKDRDRQEVEGGGA